MNCKAKLLCAIFAALLVVPIFGCGGGFERDLFPLADRMSANQLFKRAFLRKRFSEASAASAGKPGCVSVRKRIHAKFVKYAKF